MRPIFTIHAGEFIVGEYIEKRFGDTTNTWIPAKDTGIDLLVTSKNNKNSVSLQVKMSRDYSPEEKKNAFEEKFKACGWLTLKRKKIITSCADYWVICLISHHKRISPQFLVIEPKSLLDRLEKTFKAAHPSRPEPELFHFGPAVTNDLNPIALDTRSLLKGERRSLLSGSVKLGPREYTDTLDNWNCIKSL